MDSQRPLLEHCLKAQNSTCCAWKKNHGTGTSRPLCLTLTLAVASFVTLNESFPILELVFHHLSKEIGLLQEGIPYFSFLAPKLWEISSCICLFHSSWHVEMFGLGCICHKTRRCVTLMCLGGPVVLASGQAWLKTHSQGTKAEGEGVMSHII